MVHQGRLPGRDSLDVGWEEGIELASVKQHSMRQEGHLQNPQGQLVWFEKGGGRGSQKKRVKGVRDVGKEALKPRHRGCMRSCHSWVLREKCWVGKRRSV